LHGEVMMEHIMTSQQTIFPASPFQNGINTVMQNLIGGFGIVTDASFVQILAPKNKIQMMYVYMFFLQVLPQILRHIC
jgi:hypothetical protein